MPITSLIGGNFIHYLKCLHVALAEFVKNENRLKVRWWDALCIFCYFKLVHANEMKSKCLKFGPVVFESFPSRCLFYSKIALSCIIDQ